MYALYTVPELKFFIYLEVGGVVRPRAGGHHLGESVQQVPYLDVKDNNLKELFLYHINSAAVHGRQLLKSKHCFGSAFVVSGINILYV
jgi:hypothetical protein